MIERTKERSSKSARMIEAGIESRLKMLRAYDPVITPCNERASSDERSRKRWSGQSRHQASDRVDDEAIERRVQAIMERPAYSKSERVKDWRSRVRDNDRASVQAIESMIQCARNLKSERMKQRRSKKSYKRAI